MKEGSERPKSHEIGEDEKRAFVGKVSDLIRTPQFPEVATGKVTSMWETCYKIEQETVFLSMPVPGKEPEEGDKVRHKLGRHYLRPISIRRIKSKI